MRVSIFLFVAMIAALCFVGSAAQAATVHFELMDYLDGTYEVYGSASLGDNAGISYFNIDLVNILTATHETPRAMDMGTGYVRGFTVGRTNLTGDGPLFAGQDISGTTDPLIFGIGQTAGSFTLFPFATDEGVPWTAPVLIASGTYSTNPAEPNFGTEVVANVFTAVDEVDCAAAEEVTTGVTRIPEPVTLAVLGLGGLLMLLRRRRA